MSARDAILGKVRSALKVSSDDSVRAAAVRERLDGAPRGIVPARGQLGAADRVALFCQMAEKVAATVHHAGTADDVPKIIVDLLRSKNLPPSVRMGEDARLKAMPWAESKSLEIKAGRAVHEDEVGVSHAFAGIAETGTVALLSGPDNPTTVNFLPEHHIVVVDARDVAGDLETVLSDVRSKFGKGQMPRTLNLITGPSRSGDIEQTLLLGAHGPRAVHVVVVGA